MSGRALLQWPVMDALLQQVLKRHDLPRFKVEFELALADEARRREAFRAEMADSNERREFINGEIVEGVPLKVRHLRAGKKLAISLDAWVQAGGSGECLAEPLVGFARNDYKPDLCWWRAEVAAAFTETQHVLPVPDFVCEVLSPSTKAVDRGEKFADYAAAGVREYWIVDPEARAIEQYVLDDAVPAGGPARFKLVRVAREGTLTSAVIEGWAVDVAALFAGA